MSTVTEREHEDFKARIEEAQAELARRIAEYQATCDHPDYMQMGEYYERGIRQCFDCQLRARFESPSGSWGELADRRGRRRVNRDGKAA